MDQRANLLVVEALDRGHHFATQRGHTRSATIFSDLCRCLASRNCAAYRIEHQYPSQGELAHGHALWQEAANFFDGRQPGFVVYAGKSLSHVKSVSVAIESAMVVVGKGGIPTKFPGQQPAR